jgi:phosphoglycerate dehydrogenase-like enzyme
MNILITGAWSDAKKYITEIEQMGHNVCFMQYEKDELPCPYEFVEGVICNGLFLHHDIKLFTDLNFIQLTSAGYDRVPLEYINEKGIKIYNARGVYSVPMAEFAVSAVLQVYKQSRTFYDRQKNKVWEKHRGLLELFGKTVCIVGCGSVGTECAKRFSAFGCEVVGVDMYPREADEYTRMYHVSRLKEFVSAADVVVLTLPLTEQTAKCINGEVLASLREGCVLVNISRGGIIDTQALIRELSARDIYAVLDVFEDEPLPPESPLWEMKNVYITPHNSFIGDGNGKRLLHRIMINLGDESLC